MTNFRDPMVRSGRENRLLALRIYVREALGTGARPLGVVAALLVALALFLTTWHLAIVPAFRVNVASPIPPIRQAVVTIDKLSWLRPGPKGGFLMKQSFVFRVEGLDVEYPASFHANPGESIKVFYVVDQQGRILVKGIAQVD
ncbi:hypothetical protein AXG89_32890 (plasmid) [Burkholderia sp. PAMC 26561]|nr:hypothetical protein AXG89_32890 [Burkholderia sp. PAMC 26561]